jgi:hypothetical protein
MNDPLESRPGRPAPGHGSPGRREAAPLPLRRAGEQLNAARAIARQHRGGRADSPEVRQARRGLLDALTSYVAALESRNLPVPHALLTEINLYKRLS